MHILDIHTHNLSSDFHAVIDLSEPVAKAVVEGNFDPETIIRSFSPDQRFSIGIHPWSLAEGIPEGLEEAVASMARFPEVVIIGEAGIDNAKGGPLFRQMTIFKKMIELSESLAKPLLIHDVKAHDIIIGLHRDLSPKQTWIIHGFRQKPTVAEMMLREGMLLSFGPEFNALTIRKVPAEAILAETDASGCSISEVIHFLSDARGFDLTDSIAANTARLLDPIK